MQEILESNKAGEINCECWSLITEEGQDLIMKMLEKDPELRISALEAMRHSWFTLDRSMPMILSLSIDTARKHCSFESFEIEKTNPELNLSSVCPILDVSDSAVMFDSPLLNHGNKENNASSRHIDHTFQVIFDYNYSYQPIMKESAWEWRTIKRLIQRSSMNLIYLKEIVCLLVRLLPRCVDRLSRVESQTDCPSVERIKVLKCQRISSLEIAEKGRAIYFPQRTFTH